MKKIIFPLLAVLLAYPLARAFSAEGAPSVPAPAAPAALSQLGASAGQDAAPVQQAAQKLKEESRKIFQVGQAPDGKLFLKLRQDQLDRPYLFAATRDKGTGENGVDSDQMEDTFLCAFHPVGSTVQFVRMNTNFRADAGSPEAKALANSYPEASILASAPIVDFSTTTGELVFAADPLFLADLIDLARDLRESYGASETELRLIENQSHIESITPFLGNLEVRVQLYFRHPEKNSAAQPDGRVLPITMRYGLYASTGTPGFETRQADPRVGYFVDSFESHSDRNLKESVRPLVNIIHRWNLQKSDPAAPVSDVKTPIVYWLDETIPQEYREPIRAGILGWNAAFEAVGLRNAIVVKEVDKDMTKEEREKFDPADASYNMVRWFMGQGAAFAQGPHRANPVTGEIFNANVRLGDLITRTEGGEQDLASLSPNADPTRRQTLDICGYSTELTKRAAFALSALEAQGALAPDEKKRFMSELLTHDMLHEVGHNLGLRHNKRTSELLPALDGHVKGMETGFMNDFAAPPSVMAYLPANIAAPGEKQGRYFMTQPGVYDFWAIEYGYKPLAGTLMQQHQALEAVAARSATDLRLAYGTDEDVNGIDPNTQSWIIGSNPVAFARHQLALVHNLWRRVEEEKNSPSKTYGALRGSFASGLGEYGHDVKVVLPLIGGIRSHRVLRPGQSARTPYDPVSADEQREALKFLDEAVFGAKAFQASPELLVRLGGISPTRSQGLFPLTGAVLNIQRMALHHIYNPETLKRLQDSEVYAAKPGYVMGPAETLARVRQSIWKELSAGGSADVPLMRRNLQTEHVSVLARTLINPATPNGARDAARRDLAQIAKDIEGALASKTMDDATRLHLQTAALSIGAVLSEKSMNAASVLSGRR